MSNETLQPKDHYTTYNLAAGYLILVAIAVYVSYKFTVWGSDESLKNFAAVATVGITAASAIMGIVTSFVSLYKNQQAAENLENLKADLQLRFEYDKLQTTAEHGAYEKLWTSTDFAYKLLAKLETSGWTSADKIAMDTALIEAHAKLVYARQEDHRIRWEKARQRAIYISEEAAKLAAPADQPALWKKEVAEFAKLCRESQEIAEVEIKRPPTVKK